MNMNKEDNDRMFAKLTKMEIESRFVRDNRSKRIEEGAFIALIIAIAFVTGMGCISIGVDTYLKLKNNGQRNTNNIEFNLRK